MERTEEQIQKDFYNRYQDKLLLRMLIDRIDLNYSIKSWFVPTLNHLSKKHKVQCLVWSDRLYKGRKVSWTLMSAYITKNCKDEIKFI
jgi:hypothetical protein